MPGTGVSHTALAALALFLGATPRVPAALPPDAGSTLVMSCPDLPAPVNGQITKPSLGYMASVHFACNVGYVMFSGSKSRQCQADGTWDGTNPICGGSCIALPEIPSGTKTGYTYLTGHTVSYACSAAHTLIGSPSRTCAPVMDKVTGKTLRVEWNGVQPMCKFEGNPLEERDILVLFFHSTNGNQWLRRSRGVDYMNTNDLYSSNQARTVRTSDRLTEDQLDPEYKPMGMPNEYRSVGWNVRSTDGCNTNTCHCSWYGVTCNDQGLVIKLDLSSNGLSGQLSDELGGLPVLEELILSHNSIEGPIPSAWGGPVANLTRIPALSLQGFRPGLESLRVLHLNANRLSGTIPATLSQLKSLEQLHLNDNKLTRLQESWSSYTAMKSVQLQRNQLQGTIPSSMGDMLSLVSLRAYDNSITGSIPASIGGITQLNHLELNDNLISGDIPTLLSSVRYLNIAQRSKPASQTKYPCGPDDRGSKFHCGWKGGERPQGRYIGSGDVMADWGGGRSYANAILPASLHLNIENSFTVVGAGLSGLDRIKMVDPARQCGGDTDEDALVPAATLYAVSTARNNATATITIPVSALQSGGDRGIRVCYSSDGGAFTHAADIECHSIGRGGRTVTTDHASWDPIL